MSYPYGTPIVAAPERSIYSWKPHVLEAFGATTVLVTHDRDEALRLGEDLVVLVDGRVHAAGCACCQYG